MKKPPKNAEVFLVHILVAATGIELFSAWQTFAKSERQRSKY